MARPCLAAEGAHMTDDQPSPPRLAQSLLRTLLRPMDTESIPGDLLEEYREVRLPSLRRMRADVWYVKHVLSMLWRAVWPFIVAVIALRIFSFLLPSGWNPSLVPAPGVSLLDALILLLAGFYGAQRTGRLSTSIVTAGTTSLFGFITFLVYAAISIPSLLLAPLQKPFIFVIMFVLLGIAIFFGIALGLLGGTVGQRLFRAEREARLT